MPTSTSRSDASRQVSATAEAPMRDEEQLNAMEENCLREKRNVRLICHQFDSTIDDFLELQKKYDKVWREYANVEVENRLLRGEVKDIKQKVDTIQDRMQEQYDESLELKLQNAELKERNTFLASEVRRLRKIQEDQETKKVDTKKADTKKVEPDFALSFIDDRTVLDRPYTYWPSQAASPGRVSRYAETTVSSRSKASHLRSYIDPFGSELEALLPLARKVLDGPSRSSSVQASVNEHITDTETARKNSAGHKAARDAAHVTAAKSRRTKDTSQRPVSTSSSAKHKPNVRQKRTLTPALRETVQRTVSRNPDPARVWIDLPLVTDETRKYERTKKKNVVGRKAHVEDAHEEDEVAQPVGKRNKGKGNGKGKGRQDEGKAKIKSTSFL